MVVNDLSPWRTAVQRTEMHSVFFSAASIAMPRTSYVAIAGFDLSMRPCLSNLQEQAAGAASGSWAPLLLLDLLVWPERTAREQLFASSIGSTYSSSRNCMKA
jgi:hypothetical protein